MKQCLGWIAGLAVCLAIGGCGDGPGQGGPSSSAQHSADATASDNHGTAPAPGQPACWLDKLNDKALVSDGPDVDLPATQPFDLAGWIVDSEHHAVNSMQLVLTPVDGSHTRDLAAVTGIERVDVAQSLKQEAAKSSGFTVHGEARELVPGRYKATAQAMSGSANLQCNFNVVFNVKYMR